MKATLDVYENFWSQRVSGASLSLFRIFLGMFLIADALYFNLGLKGEFGEGPVVFTYPGLEWWPFHTLRATSVFLWAMAAGGGLVMVGVGTRVGLLLGALGAAQLLLRDASFFMNHLALTTILCSVCTSIPMDRFYAVQPRESSTRDSSIALYELAVPIAVLWCGYFFGGIGKIRPEWFSGETFRNLLEHSGKKHVLSRVLLSLDSNRLLAWSGFLLDLLAPLGLGWRRTRIPMALALVSFHVMNHELFSIGLFSFLMLAAFVLYFSPDWPEKVRIAWMSKTGISEPLPETQGDKWGIRGVFCIVLVLALRQFLFPVIPALSGQGAWMGWRWRGVHAPSCFVTYSKLPDPNFESVWPEGFSLSQQERLNTSIGLAWRLGRDRYCPTWKKVYAHWTCNRNPQKILSSPTELAQHLDGTLDLCMTDYSRLGFNSWVTP